MAGVTAVVGWAALALQLALIVRNLGLSIGLWRFVGFFTILTNMLAASVATAMALGRTGGLTGSRARLAAASAILLVGIVYSVALRSLWNPQGLQKLADIALHDATPILFVASWLLAPHGDLRMRDLGWALAWPSAYALYALARGAMDGWYAYWFLDPTRQSPSELAVSMAVILAAVALVAAQLIGADRLLARLAAPRVDRGARG